MLGQPHDNWAHSTHNTCARQTVNTLLAIEWLKYIYMHMWAGDSDAKCVCGADVCRTHISVCYFSFYVLYTRAYTWMGPSREPTKQNKREEKKKQMPSSPFGNWLFPSIRNAFGVFLGYSPILLLHGSDRVHTHCLLPPERPPEEIETKQQKCEKRIIYF